VVVLLVGKHKKDIIMVNAKDISPVQEKAISEKKLLEKKINELLEK